MTSPQHKSRRNSVSPGRYAAWRALVVWDKRGGVPANRLLEEVRTGLDRREQRFAHQLFLGVLRHLSRLDHLLGRVLARPLRKLSPDVRAILRLGAYQLSDTFRVPDRAVVSQSVALAHSTGSSWAAGLINASLRRLAREQHTWLEALRQPAKGGMDYDRLAVLESHPRWLVECLAERLGDALEQALRANNEQAPLTLRIHRGRISPTEFLAQLAALGIPAEAAPHLDHAVRILHPVSPKDLPGYEAGWFTVQDEASQMVGIAAHVSPGDRVLDACAAPGGKTLHLAELVGPDGHVHATDASPKRLQRLEQSVSLRFPGRVSMAPHAWGEGKSTPEDPESAPGETGPAARIRDTRSYPHDWPGTFDRVLADAPCSGLGVIRRHPDIKWLRRPDDIPRYAQRQLSILLHLADRVRPGGTLTYSVCTMTEAETDSVVRRFLEARPDFRRRNLAPILGPALAPLVDDDGFLRTLPHRHGCDGFFVALLERTSRQA